MARSPIGLDAITCASCGAKVREDRVRCLRCGQLLIAAPADRPRDGVVLTKLLVAGSVLGAAALIGIVATRPSGPVARAATPGATSAAEPASRADRASPLEQRVVTSLDARKPGEAAYLQGDVGGALERFHHAVQVNPQDPEALNNLGQMLVRTGKIAEAIAYFDRAIAIVPDQWAYHFNRARAFAELEQWGQAIAGYERAKALFPEDYVTQFNLARALQKSGDLEGAIAGYEQAIQLAPGQADFHVSHGLALEAANRPRDAAEAYKRYLELAEDAPEADKVKGRIALLEGTPAASPPGTIKP